MNQRTQAMRKRIAILIYLIIGSVAIFSVWYRLTNRESQRPPTLDATEPSRDDQSLQQVREQAKPTNRETATPIKTSEPTADESLRVATESKNVPIYFLGKVVDESDSPLPGVRVRARIRQWDVASYLSMRGKIDSKEIITGASGQFEIKDSRGDVLTIESLAKEGYEPEPIALRSFGYNTSTNISRDPTKPIILRMWKLDTKQQLAAGERSLVPVPDGRPYTIEFINGIISDSGNVSGDVRVWIKRPPEITRGERYDWEWGIEVVDGGLQEEPDKTASMYIAPESGYEPAFKMSRKVTDQAWGDGVVGKRFYIKTHDGKVHGRISIEIYAYYNARTPARVGIKYWINPLGSRILR